jgi:hypothetical protein
VRELAEDTPLGNAYLGSLVRVQFVLALRMTLALFAFLVLLLASLVATERSGGVSLFGVPIGWFLLGVVPYPSFILFAYIFRRYSERHEQEFETFVAESKSQT